MLVESLNTYLVSVPALAAALGIPRSDNMTGIFPLIAPEQTPIPYIVLQEVFSDPVVTLDGVNRFCTSRWRFSVFGSPYRSAKYVAKLLKDAMTGVPLGVSLPPVNPEANNGISIMIQAVVPVMLDVDDFEEIPHGTIFGVHQDWAISFIDNEG